MIWVHEFDVLRHMMLAPMAEGHRVILLVMAGLMILTLLANLKIPLIEKKPQPAGLRHLHFPMAMLFIMSWGFYGYGLWLKGVDGQWVGWGLVLCWFGLLFRHSSPWLYHRYHKRWENIALSWKGILFVACFEPIIILISIFFLVVGINVVMIGFHVDMESWHRSLILEYLLFIVLFLWIFHRFMTRLEQAFLKRGYHRQADYGLDLDTVSRLCRFLKVVAWVFCGVTVLSLLKMPLAGLLTFGGMGTLALTLAGKDLLANFFGGLMLRLDRPFDKGDWIRSPDKNIEGTVEHIGLRVTRIRTFDKRPLYVPNSVFLSISVENPSRMSNRRIKTTLGLRYADVKKVPTILSEIEQMLRNHEAIDTKQTLMVNLVACADSSLDVLVYTFTKTTNWVKFQAVQQDVLLRILNIIEKHKAQCAFPTTTFDLPDVGHLTPKPLPTGPSH